MLIRENVMMSGVSSFVVVEIDDNTGSEHELSGEYFNLQTAMEYARGIKSQTIKETIYHEVE